MCLLLAAGLWHGTQSGFAEGEPTFTASPASVHINPGQSGVSIAITAAALPASNIVGMHLQVTYDPTVITATDFVCSAAIQNRLLCPKILTPGSAVLDMVLDQTAGQTLVASAGPVEIGTLTIKGTGAQGSTTLQLAQLEIIGPDVSSCLTGYQGQLCTGAAPSSLPALATVTADSQQRVTPDAATPGGPTGTALAADTPGAQPGTPSDVTAVASTEPAANGTQAPTTGTQGAAGTLASSSSQTAGTGGTPAARTSATATAGSSKGQGGDNNNGLLIGVGIVAVLVVVGLGAGGYYWYQRKRRAS